MRFLVALLPVLLFLAFLLLLDSFKLVRPRALLASIAWGVAAGLAAAAVNGWIVGHTDLELRVMSRYVAPLVEEPLKAAWVWWLLRRQRVGFLVDAAIHGFAVGTGFALYENVEYLRHLPSAGLGLWFVRGFGTAILHGATTALFALLAKSFAERHAPGTALLVAVTGAGAVHSVHNHFVLPPALGALVLALSLPALLLVVFQRSERMTRRWMTQELDGDVDLLEVILSGGVAGTRVGDYLLSLRSRFPGEVVADMLCLLQLQLEIKIRAKGILIAREAGLDLPVDEELRASLAEVRYLEDSIGRTGMMAMHPIMGTGSLDVWQMGLMKEVAGRRPGA